MEQAIVHTFDLLVEFNKLDDAISLLDGSIDILHQIKAGQANQADK
jgi:hypothetical protein